MLTINLVFILRKSVNYSVNLFSNRNMNSAIVMVSVTIPSLVSSCCQMCRVCTNDARSVGGVVHNNDGIDESCNLCVHAVPL